VLERIEPVADRANVTLAGNFTVLGSIANLIVVQRAAASGVEISFWDYFRVGAPLTIISLAIGTLWLWL
jgi:Na+/H+ antiporter NhaD/arsenite permease-like protein